MITVKVLRQAILYLHEESYRDNEFYHDRGKVVILN